MSFIYNMTDTWNSLATVFTAIKMNVTDTASDPASLLMDLQVGGSSKFKVGKGGNVTMPTGSTLALNGGAVAISLLAATSSTSAMALGYDGSTYAIDLGSAVPLRWTNGSTVLQGGSADLFLYRDAANVLAQRNGTNQQTHNLYHSYTDAANNSFIQLRADPGFGGYYEFISKKNGTGTVYPFLMSCTNGGEIGLYTDGHIDFNFQNVAIRWTINTSGHFVGGSDNTYDIGAPAANRPRHAYIGSSITAGTWIKTAAVTLASLSASIATAVSAGVGARAYVTDITTLTFGTTVAGSGANSGPVYSDGTQWRAG